MLCRWVVKAGMACLHVKLCVAISERFRKDIWYLKTLYKKCPGLLYFFTYTDTHRHTTHGISRTDIYLKST